MATKIAVLEQMPEAVRVLIEERHVGQVTRVLISVEVRH